MASTPRTPRRGLPRVPGGEPWPPAGSDASGDASPPDAGGSSQSGAHLADSAPRETNNATNPELSPTDAEGSRPEPGSGATVRRGLPREPGGEPWPPASLAPSDADATPVPASDRGDAIGSEVPSRAVPVRDPASDEPAGSGTASRPAAAPAETDAVAGDVRRGLPREPGGEPWPPASGAGSRAAAESQRRDGVGAGAPTPPTSVPVSDRGSEQDAGGGMPPRPLTSSRPPSGVAGAPAAPGVAGPERTCCARRGCRERLLRPLHRE